MPYFQLSPTQLASLFNPSSIRHGTSYQALSHWGGISALEALLRTNYSQGLTSDATDNEERVHWFGDNRPLVQSSQSLWQLIAVNFKDEMIQILCIAALVSLVLGMANEGVQQGWWEGVSILVAVLIIIIVIAVNHYLQERQFHKLNGVASQTFVQVHRNGQTKTISAYDLLVGDMVYVDSGSVLAFDAIIIEGDDLLVDESSLTGQSKEVEKKTFDRCNGEGSSSSPFLISGSRVLEGKTLAVVAAVGQHSIFGKIKLKISQPRGLTPLQTKLRTLAQQIGRISVFAALTTFVILFLHYLYRCWASQHFRQHFLSMESLHQIVQYFVLGVSIVVVSVPQGLHLSVTIALAYSVGQMREQNNLVRQLSSCQTMGGADNILCDKTGTLTCNQMSLHRLFIEEVNHQLISREALSESGLKLLSAALSVNSTATPNLRINENSATFEPFGNRTQCALLQGMYRLGIDYHKLRIKDRIIKVFPFSPSRKMMATIFKDDRGRQLVFVKGAPDLLLPYCSSYLTAASLLAKVTPQVYDVLTDVLEDYAFQSLRAVLIAYKEVATIPQSWQQLQRNLTFIALAGIKDPLRKGVSQAINVCKQAGVRVRMVTGDNKRTAIAVAKELGILSSSWYERDDDCSVMEGKEFIEFVGGLVNEGTPEEAIADIKNFAKVNEELCVLARSSPQDKYVLTVGLRQLGHVVAVTGDGTNDAPALRRADIGFAMGVAGTDVAKQAADIVLLDDNFSSLVTALKWGRNIFDSIRKFIQFQLTVNMVALAMALIGSLLLGQSPLTPIQMLWVNLIMDTLAALALATQPPADNLLCRKPYSKEEPLVTVQMWRFIIWQAVWQLIVLSIVLFKGAGMLGLTSSVGLGEWNENTGKHYCIFFNVFIYLQVFNEINARKVKHSQANPFHLFFNNRIFLIIILTTIVAQLLTVMMSSAHFRTVPLSFKENLLCLILGSTSLLSALLFKTIIPPALNEDAY